MFCRISFRLGEKAAAFFVYFFAVEKKVKASSA